ncbi:unnamed protein product [Cylindrotheca closterium]|uniref:TonB C-terminal domain-containing protein n=1 Tax=Cylindrotheca closterium TaxID=2856 RepID=A0AAD2GDZ3_9STRA|nr:unnamed protein product [Cylindrotheca closterium]
MKVQFSSTAALMIMMTLDSSANAFAPKSTSSSSSSALLKAQKIGTPNYGGDFDPNSLGGTNVQSIEFKIYPDGRVEEKVIGVKGGNCHSVTEKINESLGKVVESAPTEELYENEVVVTTEQTITNSVSTNNDNDASWEGQSSW